MANRDSVALPDERGERSILTNFSAFLCSVPDKAQHNKATGKPIPGDLDIALSGTRVCISEIVATSVVGREVYSFHCERREA